jgi:hypothetical protein
MEYNVDGFHMSRKDPLGLSESEGETRVDGYLLGADHLPWQAEQARPTEDAIISEACRLRSADSRQLTEYPRVSVATSPIAMVRSCRLRAVIHTDRNAPPSPTKMAATTLARVSSIRTYSPIPARKTWECCGEFERSLTAGSVSTVM